jgi:drug/metabolite transporter (DMT)-like permease
MEKKTAIAHMGAIFVMLIWGTSYLATKALLTSGLVPVQIIVLRFLIGYLCLLVAGKPLKLETRKDELLFIASGFFGVAAYFLCENYALVYSYSSNVGVIVSLAPFFTSVLVRDERKPRGFLAGFAVAMAGIITISYNGAATFKLNPIGDLLALGAALCWGFYSFFLRKINDKGYDSIKATRRVFFWGLLFLLPFLRDLDVRLVFTSPCIWSLLFLGMGSTALCYLIWTNAVKTIGAVKSAIYIYLIPVIAVLSGILFLSEKANWASIGGLVLCLGGLLLSEGVIGREKA